MANRLASSEVVRLGKARCFQCKRPPGKVLNRQPLLQTDRVNEWLGHQLFPPGHLVCRRCVRKAAQEARLSGLIEYVAFWSHA